MTNAEIIKALSECEYCNVCSIAVDGECPFGGRNALEVAAADALEAADKKIEMSKIDIEVNANVNSDARWILNRQERMEKQRFDFIADLIKYTANLILTYDEDEADGERRKE